jgi:hypothetical protein
MDRYLSWKSDITIACSSYQASFSDDVVTDTYDFCQAISNTFEDANCQLYLSQSSSYTASGSCCQLLQSNYDRFCYKQSYAWSDSHLLIVTLIFLLCSLVSSFIEKMQIHWLPEAGGCILVGILCGFAIQVIPGRSITFFCFSNGMETLYSLSTFLMFICFVLN